MSESPYLKQEIENYPEPEYINDLRILRRFVQNGSFGFHQSEDAGDSGPRALNSAS